jgi:hypothetical protein
MSVRGKGWDEVPEFDRDCFLLAAVGGTEEWQSVMSEIGLDNNAAAKVATAICPMKSAPRSDDERRERERAALNFQGGRPLGRAFRDALLRRDAPPVEAVAAGPKIDAAPSHAQGWDMERPQRLSGAGRDTAGIWVTPEWLKDRRGRAVAAMTRGLSGLWHRTSRFTARISPAISDACRALPKIAVSGTPRHSVPAQPKPPRTNPYIGARAVLDGGLNEDGATIADDVRVMEMALARWRGMGPALKDIIVGSALRGFPPALAFVRLVAPHARPAASPAPTEETAAWEADVLRHGRMLTALEREGSLLFRLFRIMIPPIG